MEFCGHYKSTVDPKWRLKIPVEYREYLLQNYGDTFFITSADLESLLVYPLKVWEEIQLESKKNPSLAEKIADLNLCGRVSKMDGQGKVLLSEYMRTKNPQLLGTVIVTAVVDHLEVYPWEMVDKILEAGKISNKLLSKIRAGGNF